MRVLVTGGNGQLGRCLQDRLKNSEHEWQSPDQGELDITDEAAIQSYYENFQPEIVINAAAYTAVDQAETDKECAHLVNTVAPGFLAAQCNKFGIPLIHISTDYVFDGTATVPYTPIDKTNPVSVYGETKLAGEVKVQQELKEHVIIRTAWVFSEYGKNFVKSMLNLAQNHSILKIVGDQYGCPTYAGDLADAILQIVELIIAGNKHWGIFHYTGDQVTSWHGFARAIFDEACKQKIITDKPNLRVINTDEFPVAATRPEYSVLNSEDIYNYWGSKQASWRDSLSKIICRI